jgi:tetratricopeptide (TPR) repeat protein
MLSFVRFSFLLILVITSSSLVTYAQVCSQKAGPAVEMQIRLSFDDRSAFQGDSINTGSVNVQNDASHRAGSASAETQNAGANMQIRVQLQDAFGSSSLQESSPSSDGRVTFRVCSKVNYRVRVFGPDIDEALVEGVDPGRTDRIMNIVLHHKRSTLQSNAGTATVSATRLQVPPKAQKELDHGNSALADGRLKDAQKNFEKAIEIYPEFDQAYNNLGVVLMQTGDSKGGEVAFSKAIAINDHFARAYVNLAKIRLSEKNYQKAEDLLRKATSADPLNAQTLFLAEEAAFFQGKGDQVIADARKIHTLDHEKYALCHFMAARALEGKSLHDQALEEYRLFLKEAPNDPNAKTAQLEIKQIQKNRETH